MKLRAAALLAALTIPGAPARAEQLPIKSYTTADGLPSDRIPCILADSHGFLWFGTWDGLARFDGYGFRNFGAADGLPPGPVQALVESRDGTYWAGTTAGLARLDLSGGPARPGASLRLLHVPGGGPRDDVGALLEDRAAALWIGTGDGLWRLDTAAPGAPRFEKVRLGSPNGRDAAVNALHQDRDGTLWAGAEDGLYRRAPDGTVERVAGPDGAPHSVRCLARDRGGALWIGTHEEGLFLVSPSAAPELPRRAYSAANGLAGDHVTALLETSDGTIWATCFGGLSEIPADRSALRTYTIAEGLSGTGAWSLAEDRAGNLWIGSDNTGVMRLARGGFRRFDGRDGLTSLRVGALFEDRDGEVCAFTRGQQPDQIAGGDGFLECFDGRRFRTRRPPLPAGTLYGWGLSQVTLQDHSGEWWVPTLSGLFRFPATSFPGIGSAPARRIYGRRDGLSDDRLVRLYEDRRGDLWIGLVGERGNLARWERRTDSIRTFSAADGIPERQPLSFAEDREGAVWIGLLDGGLARYREGAMTFFDSASGLPAGSVRALLCDRDGRLWIATSRGGVARVDRPEEARPAFAAIGLAQGLSSANTSSLAEDGLGRLYVGTERALDRLDPRTGDVEHFTTDDGLARGVVETSLRDRAGNLWFGSPGGLSRLTPAARARRPAAPVRILRVLANGVPQPLPEIGASAVSLPARAPEPTSVQIDFVALDFAPGGRPRYQYRVDGIDRDWSAPTAQSSVVYARLPAGRYRFRVRAVAGGDAPAPPEATVAFAVRPTFWKRPEVLAALSLGLLGVAFAFHRSRLKRVLAVERVRARVAKDLHDDVGSGLSEIAILSEVARQENGGGGAPAPALREIGDAARRLVDSMSDIVWSTDPRRDDVGSLLARVRHFAANTLESRGIAWTLDVPPEFETRTLDPETRRQVFLILKEALANVARHSGCRRAALRIVPGPRDAWFEIEDDGAGFSPEAGTPAGNGLGNMRSRAAALGGELRLESVPSSGTRIRVRVPIGRPPLRPSA